MYSKRKLTCLVMVLCCMGTFAACGGSDTAQSQGETLYYSVTIDGERDYIDENDERIVKLTETMQSYISAFVTKDYENPDVDTEMDFYTSNVQQSYEEAGRAESNLAIINNYDLMVQLDEATIKGIEFYRLNGLEAATVTCEYTSTLKNSTDEYLKNQGMKKDTKYARTITTVFVLEDDTWKVSKYSQSSRAEVN